MCIRDREKAIEFGNILHEILSFIKTKNDIPLALIKAQETGLIVRMQKETVEQTLHTIVDHEELRLFFEEADAIYNEQSIIKKDSRTIKPDRVVIRGKTAYLLDYKTGAHQAKYARQLEDYELALQEMGYEVAKKTLVYIGETLNVIHL